MARYLRAQLDANRRGALRTILDEGLHRGVAVPALHLEVIQPAQYEIGRLWQQNRISVAQEHLATAISELAVAHLYPHLPREPEHGKRVMVACVEGETHAMGPRIAADFLEMGGFDVRFLGANVPTDHLLDMVRRERPELLVLSATMSFYLPAVRDVVARVRDAVGDATHLAVGGHAFRWAPDEPARLGLAPFGSDARELVDRAKKLLRCA